MPGSITESSSRRLVDGSSSSLGSYRHFARNTVSKLDSQFGNELVELEIRRKHKSLAQYNRAMKDLDFRMSELERREAMLRGGFESANGRLVRVNCQRPFQNEGMSSDPRQTQNGRSPPVFAVPSGRKPVVILGSRERSHAAALRGHRFPKVMAMEQVTNVADQQAACGTDAKTPVGPQAEARQRREARMDQFTNHLATMIEDRLDKLVDARLEQCKTAKISLHCRSCRMIAAKRQPRPAVCDTVLKNDSVLSGRPSGVQSGNEQGCQIEKLKLVQEESELKVVQDKPLVDAVQHKPMVDAVAMDKPVSDPPEKQDVAPVETPVPIRDAIDDKKSCAGPVEHDRLAALTHKLSNTSLPQEEVAGSGAECSDNNHVPHRTTPPVVRDAGRGVCDALSSPRRRRKVKQTSPLAHVSEDAQSVCDAARTEAGPDVAATRRRPKQDSSMSLGFKMDNCQAFDLERNINGTQMNVRTRTGRHRLRYILFGV